MMSSIRKTINTYLPYWQKMKWQKNSLKYRLLVSALIMVIVMLPIIGITLTNAFDKQLASAMKNELSAYSYSILAVAEVENQQLIMPDALLESQFNVSQSGLYAFISQSSKSLWASQSTLIMSLPKKLPSPQIGDFVFSEADINNIPHLIYSFSVNFNENNQDFAITLHIIKSQAQYFRILNEFKYQLWAWLALLMLVFIIVQIIWLLWTLKPLTLLAQELTSVEQGKQNALTAFYPQELQQVTRQLNTLLQTEQNQRKRYRNALADLAHSLKNPLAVLQSDMQNELTLSSHSAQQLTVINQMIEHQLKRAQSAGESAWHLGIPIQDTVKKLTNSLVKIYHNKSLDFQLNIESNATFKGDKADFMEMLGNILDNACKAAQQTIIISATQTANKLVITIEDDGLGIEASKREHILQRGLRADTYQQGHGIGLAIVRDLVESYQGELHITHSTSLSGAKFILTF